MIISELIEYDEEVPIYPDGTLAEGPYFRKDQLKVRIEFLLSFFKDEDKRLIEKILYEVLN
jgi:hypothetical protein